MVEVGCLARLGRWTRGLERWSVGCLLEGERERVLSGDLRGVVERRLGGRE